MARLEMLEVREALMQEDGKRMNGGDHTADRSQNERVRKHIMSGGWPPNTPRNSIEKEARYGLAKQRDEVRNSCLQPCARIDSARSRRSRLRREC